MKTFCQPEAKVSEIKKSIDLIEDKASSGKNKLEEFYALQRDCIKYKKVNDSNFVFVLIKLAKYECLANQDYDLAIQYNLAAINLNKSLKYKISLYAFVTAYYNLATFYDAELLYSKALSCYDTVIHYVGKADPDQYLLLCRLCKARIYFFTGDYQKSIEENTFGINTIVLKTGDDSAFFISFLNYRAQSYMFENQLSQALADINTVLQLSKKVNTHFETATAYKTSALVYQKMKQYDKAEIFLKQAVQERLITKNDEVIASDYNDLGNLYHLAFRNSNLAESCYYNTIRYASKITDNNMRSLKLFMAYENLGTSSVDKNDFAKAIQFYTTAYSSINIKLTDFLMDNPNQTKLTSIQNSDLILDILFGKVELLLKLYTQTKRSVYLQSSLQTARYTDSIITQIRHNQIGEKSKLYWRDKTRDFFNNTIEACYLANNQSEAFYFMEKSRAVLLYDKLNEIGASANLPVKESDQIEDLRTKLIKQQQELSTLKVNSPEYSRQQFVSLQTKDSLERFISSLEKKYPLYYRYKYDDEIFSIASLKQYLTKNNQSFIYYFMSDSAIYSLSISKNKTSFIKISANDFNSNQLSQFINLCSNKEAINNNYETFSSLSQTIYNKLFKPLQLPKGNVAICTDNFFIPFEALCTDDKGKNFLLYNYNFSYVYSARSLIKPYTGSKAAGSFAGFAPVSFAPSLNVFPLQSSASALENVSGYYSSNTLFIKQQATRNNFLTQAAKYAVVTIFSHAQADTTDKEPVLYMQDSLIHLSELQMLRNPAIQFVLLSACQTNIGKNATGEGIYSLARGFAAAGVPSVSATLWKADEETVYKISTEFNKYLAAGMNKSKALQKAKVWYLHSSNKEHTLPYYWANIVLIGTSQPVTLTKPNHSWIWITILVFLISSFGFYLIYRKRKQQNFFNT